MLSEVQYVWLYYRLYITIVLHTIRYLFLGWSLITEINLAECLGCGVLQRTGVDTAVSEAVVLFGHKRDGAEIIMANLSIIYYNRYTEGKAAIEKPLSCNKDTETS